jgi:hypothetical protein
VSPLAADAGSISGAGEIAALQWPGAELLSDIPKHGVTTPGGAAHEGVLNPDE